MLLVAWVVAMLGCNRTGGEEFERAETGDVESTRAEVTLLAAASTADAVKELAEVFGQQRPEVEVRISTGPSNGLAQQILAGAPADVYLAANSKWADVVTDEGLVAETVSLLTNRLVLIVPRGNPARVQRIEDVVSDRVSRVAIASSSVPAGDYAEQILGRRELLEPLLRENKLARGSDVRITLSYVERGEAEAGIVYATDARISDQVEVVVLFDPQGYERVVYPAVLLKSAANRSSARELFDFLQGAEARAVFERYGFEMLVDPSLPTSR